MSSSLEARDEVTAAKSDNRRSKGLVFAMLGVLSVFPLLPLRSAWVPLSGTLAGLTYASARSRALPAMRLGTFCTLLLVALSAFGSMKYWPIPPLLAAAGYAGAAARVSALGGWPEWLARGRLDRTTGLLILTSIGVASLGLVIWFAAAKPDYTHLVGTLFPRFPVPLLFVGVVGFSMINAALEEFIYRGLLLSSLDAALGIGIVPIVLQLACLALPTSAASPAA